MSSNSRPRHFARMRSHVAAFSDSSSAILRVNTMNTFLLRIDTKPIVGSEHFGRFAGACFTALIVSETPGGAIRRAADHAARLGWFCEEIRDVHTIERSAAIGDARFLNLWDTAQRNGIAVIIDTFAVKISATN